MPQEEPIDRGRERRAMLRQARKRQQQLLRIRLMAAGVVLALCAALIYFLSRSAPQSADPQTVQAASTASSAPLRADQQVEEQLPETVIHFAAAGDLIVCDETVNAGGASYDYSDAFLDVLPLLADADLTVLNFEGNLVGSPYGTATASAPTQMLTALKEAGVDMLQVANSRSITNGITGLTATLQAVRAAGLEPLGAYATNADFRAGKGYTIREVEGIRIALVAFTKGMDNMSLPAGSEDCVNLLYTDYDADYQDVDTSGINQVMRALAEEQPDITIALLHWGSEYNDLISDSQEEIRDLLLSQGVDVIIGTHPHYVQSIEYNQDNGQLVCYSLGDFFGAADRAGTDYSIVLDLEITKDNNTGDTRVTDYSYTPICTTNDGGQHRVLRLEEAITGYEMNYVEAVTPATYEDLQYNLERILDRVQPDQE